MKKFLRANPFHLYCNIKRKEFLINFYLSDTFALIEIFRAEIGATETVEKFGERGKRYAYQNKVADHLRDVKSPARYIRCPISGYPAVFTDRAARKEIGKGTLQSEKSGYDTYNHRYEHRIFNF